MDLPLDTCAFIWWDSGGGNLSAAALTALQDPANRLHLSLASLWEMQLKHQKGKLLLRKALADIIQEQCAQNGLLLWTTEAKRRRDEVRSGRVKPIPAEGVYRRIDRILGR